MHLARSELVLGIDGGGSHTVALLAAVQDEAGAAVPHVLGRGWGGPSNYQAVGRSAMVQSLDDAIAQAFAMAGLPVQPVAAACLGLAGVDRPDDQQTVRNWATEKRIADRLAVENDGRLVVAAGTPDDWGLALIAGTGSFALARRAGGQTRRAGGWGYLFGDEGSAYAIALDGLRAVTQSHDGSGPATSLRERMLDRLGITDVSAIVSAVYGSKLDRAELARLAEVVTGAAQAGDLVALKCLDDAAGALARTAQAAAKLLVDEVSVQVPVAFSGSLLTSCRLYADLVFARLRVGLGAEPEPLTFVHEPAAGAVRLAKKLVR